MLVSDQDLKYGAECCLSMSGKNILEMFTDFLNMG